MLFCIIFRYFLPFYHFINICLTCFHIIFSAVPFILFAFPRSNVSLIPQKNDKKGMVQNQIGYLILHHPFLI